MIFVGTNEKPPSKMPHLYKGTSGLSLWQLEGNNSGRTPKAFFNSLFDLLIKVLLKSVLGAFLCWKFHIIKNPTGCKHLLSRVMSNLSMSRALLSLIYEWKSRLTFSKVAGGSGFLHFVCGGGRERSWTKFLKVLSPDQLPFRHHS